MKVTIKIISLTMIALFIISTQCIFADDELLPELLSSHAIVIETDRGQVLYRKGADVQISSHISAVIMTALLSAEKSDRPSVITVSSIYEDVGIKTLPIEVGDKISTEDLMSVMLLRSAPDIAVLLADSLFGSVSNFVTRMNEKAASLGLASTSYTVSGSDTLQISALTTLDDLSKLLFHCMKNQLFRRIFSSKIFLWPLNDGNNEIMPNSNDLIWRLDNITGGMKTLSGRGAGSAAVTASSLNNLNLLCIIAEEEGQTKDQEAGILFEYAYTNFRRGILAAKGQPLAEAQANGTIVKLSPNTDIYYIYPIGHAFVENVSYQVPDKLSLPVLRSEPAGSLTYILTDNTVINVILYPDTDIYPEISLMTKMLDRIKENRGLMNAVLFLIGIEILLLLYKTAAWIKKAMQR